MFDRNKHLERYAKAHIPKNKLACSCGAQYIRKDKFVMHKEHVNQMKTKVDSDFDKDSDNHAMGTTYEASFINMILDLMLRVLEMTLVMQIYQ